MKVSLQDVLYCVLSFSFNINKVLQTLLSFFNICIPSIVQTVVHLGSEGHEKSFG